MPSLQGILRGAFGLFIGICFTAAAARAQAPADEAAFTKEMAARFAQALPESRVEVKGPLTLGLSGAGLSAQFQINLNRVWDFCVRNRDACAAAMAQHVAVTAASLRDVPDVDVASLRMVVRPAGYVAAIKQQSVGQAGAQPIAAPYAGDLWLMLVTDTPNSLRAVTVRDLQKLNMNIEQAVELALRNVEALLPPLSKVVRPLPANGVGRIEGDYYESSRLLVHEDSWTELARSFKGRLLVAVPDPHVVLYADGKVPKSREALIRLAKEVAGRSDRPLSIAVLQWSRDGWKAVGR